MIITSTVSPVLKIGLQFLGIWPGISHFTIRWLSFVLSMLVIQYFQYLYILNHFKISELLNLVDSMTVTLNYSLTFLKLTSLWIHRRVLHQILAAMDNDWRECVNVEQHFYIMQNKANVSHFYCNFIVAFNAIASIPYFLGDYVTRYIFLTEDYNDTLRHFPMRVQLPYETQQSPLFEFLFVILFLIVMLHGYTIAIVNGLIFTLVFHVSGQIDIICQEFKSMSENIILHKSSSFEMLIERHNKIISFFENIEKLFSFIALMQVVWNTLVICTIGFAFIIFIHNETGVLAIVKIILAYFAITLEAFIICFAGEYLSHKGKLIANATYEMMWYDMPLNHSKMVIFIIMRSQKRLTITAGKMTDMSLEVFTNIIKASASYISVFNAMYR